MSLTFDRALIVVVQHARVAEAALKLANVVDDADGFDDEEVAETVFDVSMSTGMLLIHAIADALRVAAPDATEEAIDHAAHDLADYRADGIRVAVRHAASRLAREAAADGIPAGATPVGPFLAPAIVRELMRR